MRRRSLKEKNYERTEVTVPTFNKIIELPYNYYQGRTTGDILSRINDLDNVRDMIIEHRNHPSIILWGVRINESNDDNAFYQE